VCYSVLQCVAVLLQCVTVCCSVLQCVAVCCSVLQCVAVCCSVSQCAAVCCSMLQCVVVCCSMLQCGAVRVLTFVVVSARKHIPPWKYVHRGNRHGVNVHHSQHLFCFLWDSLDHCRNSHTTMKKK